LLKYAVVIPKWTQPTILGNTEPRGDMPMLRLQDPHDIPHTTVDHYTGMFYLFCVENSVRPRVITLSML